MDIWKQMKDEGDFVMTIQQMYNNPERKMVLLTDKDKNHYMMYVGKTEASCKGFITRMSKKYDFIRVSVERIRPNNYDWSQDRLVYGCTFNYDIIDGKVVLL